MICNHCKKDIGNEAVCPYCQTRRLKEHLPHYLLDGTVIGGKYRIEGVLGEGGFGITYLGHDDTLDMPVAIKEYFPHGFSYRNSADGSKVISRSDKNDSFFDQGKKRFLNEARTLVRFNEEPGVVSAMNFVEENNSAYLIMEYLEGITLQQYLKQHGTMSANGAISLLEPVMRTLAKIHEAGVIHRDISPDNIMRLHDGQLKLMDFGAARDFGGDNRSMSVMLKQGYAPEEQYRRTGDQGPWTDVYALCATIYRCITGETPVDSLDRLAEDTLQKPSSLGAKISPATEKVLLYGMAVRKNDRCPNMLELLSCFEQARQGVDPNINRQTDNDREMTLMADMPYIPSDAKRREVSQSAYTVNNVQQVVVQPKPKKKKTWLIVLIIVFVCVAAAAAAGYFVFFSSSSAKDLESVTWSNKNKDGTYYYEFNTDGTLKVYLGTIETTGSYQKNQTEDGNTVTVDKTVGSFVENMPCTYSISGKEGDLVMDCSYSDDQSFTLNESKRGESPLELPENFVPDNELLGTWIFRYMDYDIYRVTFNSDGTMALEFVQDGIKYNGIYTIEGSTINFTYYASEKVETPLEYSVDGDNLTFMGYDFVRESD